MVKNLWYHAWYHSLCHHDIIGICDIIHDIILLRHDIRVNIIKMLFPRYHPWYHSHITWKLPWYQEPPISIILKRFWQLFTYDMEWNLKGPMISRTSDIIALWYHLFLLHHVTWAASWCCLGAPRARSSASSSLIPDMDLFQWMLHK